MAKNSNRKTCFSRIYSPCVNPGNQHYGSKLAIPSVECKKVFDLFGSQLHDRLLHLKPTCCRKRLDDDFPLHGGFASTVFGVCSFLVYVPRNMF